MDWLPIHTAPKNGPPLLGWLVPKLGEFGHPRAASIYWQPVADGGYWHHSDGVTTNWQPSHWAEMNAPDREPDDG